jgi:hypothetical protein
MADVYLSTTMRRLVAEYGNPLEARQGIYPAIIAYDLGPHEGHRADLPAKDGLAQSKTVSRKGDRDD